MYIEQRDENMRKLLKNLALLASTAISTPAFAETESAASLLENTLKACHEETLATSKAACLRDAYDDVVVNAISTTGHLLSIPTTDDYSRFIQQQDSARLSTECPLFEQALTNMPPTDITQVSSYFLNIARGCAEFTDTLSRDIQELKQTAPQPATKPVTP
jgi:hypothetical protein